MRILIVCHKPIDSDTPRGAELSVLAIVRYLRNQGHIVETINTQPTVSYIHIFDLVGSWGAPALEAAKRSEEAGVPFFLMVRFWKNIAPLPAGDLLSREVDSAFACRYAAMFRYAKAIITNSAYAKSVIHRWQPDTVGKTYVSYVPIIGSFDQKGDITGGLTIVTPEVYGEYRLVKELSSLLPGRHFHIVNADEKTRLKFVDVGESVFAYGYCDIGEIWAMTKILLVPVYDNDICGTRRVTIEALRHGIPVIATDRSGMREKIPVSMLVPRNAGAAKWESKIIEIENNYELFCRRARRAWMRYDTVGQLEQLEKILLECV